jgi:uncharacterized protein
MKKLSVCLLTFLLVFLFAFSVSANDSKSRLTDGADLLTFEEHNRIAKMLDDVSFEYEYDVVIRTVETIGDYQSEAAFAQDAFRNGGYGLGEKRSGVILVIFESERRAYIEFFGEKRLPEGTALLEDLVPALKNGNYASACLQFAESVDGNLSFPWLRNVAIAVIIGLVIAFFVTASMKSKLKSVRYQSNAREYIRHGSFNLKHSRDLYLYSTVTRVARPKNNSGGMRGGGGGSRGGGVSF